MEDKTKVPKFSTFIEGRVVRFWSGLKSTNPEKRGFASFEILFVDKNGNVFQASVFNNARHLTRQISRMIREGQAYRMDKYQLLPNYGREAATPHKWRYRIRSTTIIQEIEDENIPSLGFNFVSFQAIIDNNLGPRSYIDVAGQVEEYNAILQSGPLTCSILEVHDIRGTKLPIWIWGRLTEKIKTIASDPKFVSENPIIVFQCVQRAPYQGEMRISTTDATKIYFKPDIAHVNAIIASNANRGPAIRNVVKTTWKHIGTENDSTEVKNLGQKRIKIEPIDISDESDNPEDA